MADQVGEVALVKTAEQGQPCRAMQVESLLLHLGEGAEALEALEAMHLTPMPAVLAEREA